MPVRATHSASDARLKSALETLEQRGLLRQARLLSETRGPRARIDGRDVLLMCSNDYLGLSDDRRLADAAKAAMDAHGFGSGASRLISGSREPHVELERAIAEFKGTEAALLFGSGYMANVGVISALVGPGDVVCSDALNHASLIDGCRLSGATIQVYPHGDMGALSAKLRGARKARRRLVVTDGVFSMDGDLAPLASICSLAEAHDAWVLVDDAHGTGVIGPRGRGTAAHFGVTRQVHFHVGTFSKAFGGYGAFVAGTHTAMQYVLNHARSFIFTTAPPVAQTAAALAALHIIQSDPLRRQRLTELSKTMRVRLQDLGYSVPPGETPIIPLHVGDPEATMRLSETLLEEGVFAQGIRPPTVPPGTSRLRVTVMATHTEEDLSLALTAFDVAGKKAGLFH